MRVSRPSGCGCAVGIAGRGLDGDRLATDFEPATISPSELSSEVCRDNTISLLVVNS